MAEVGVKTCRGADVNTLLNDHGLGTVIRRMNSEFDLSGRVANEASKGTRRDHFMGTPLTGTRMTSYGVIKRPYHVHDAVFVLILRTLSTSRT